MLVKFWEKPEGDKSDQIKALRSEFPPLLGKGKWLIVNGGFGSNGIPVLLILVWGLLIILTPH
jgi:hypothetical protein